MSTATSWSQSTISNITLLQRLRNPADQAAWECVQARYGRVLEQFARRRGLSPELAQDACQETLLAFCQRVRRGLSHDSQRARSLLFTIARNKSVDLHRREQRFRATNSQAADSDVFRNLADDDDHLQTLWDDEWRKAVAAACLHEAKLHFAENTYSAYHLHKFGGVACSAVASQLSMTTAAVEGAVKRVRKFLADIRPQIEASF